MFPWKKSIGSVWPPVFIIAHINLVVSVTALVVVIVVILKIYIKVKKESRLIEDQEAKSKSTSNARAELKKESKAKTKSKSKSTSNTKTKSKKTSESISTSISTAKGTPIPEPKCPTYQKLLLTCKIVFIVLILVSIGLIVWVFLINSTLVEENMNEIVNATNLTLQAAKLKLDGISSNELNKTIDRISNELESVGSEFQYLSGFVNITMNDKNYLIIILTTKRGMNEYKKTTETLNAKFPTECGAKIDLAENLVEILQQVEQNRAQSNLLDVNKRILELGATLTNHAKNQEKLDFGASKIENHLRDMGRLLAHFQSDIENTENKRKEYSRKIIDSPGPPNTPIESKVLVSITCSALIICSIIFISCLSKLKFLGEKRPFFGVSLSICPTALLTITASFIIVDIFMSVEALCPLKGVGFGLSNFTSPLHLSTIKNISICVPSDSNFYSALSNNLLMSSVNFSEVLQFQHYKKMMLATANSSNLSVEISPSFSQNVKLIENGLNNLNVLIDKKCLDDPIQKELEGYQTLLKSFLKETGLYTNMIDEFNKNMTNTDTVLGPLLNSIYVKIEQSLKDSISKIQKNITDSDFSCLEISNKYIDAGPSICKILDGPKERYNKMFLVLLTTCFCCLLLQIIVLITLICVGKKYVEQYCDLKTPSTSRAMSSQSSAPSTLKESKSPSTSRAMSSQSPAPSTLKESKTPSTSRAMSSQSSAPSTLKESKTSTIA